MLTAGRGDPRHYRPDSLMSQVVEFISRHPEGASSAQIKARFPGKDVHTCLSGLIRAGRVTRPRRAVYTVAESAQRAQAESGVKPVTVRTTLTTFSMVVQSYVDQGALPRNVIALVERPADEIGDDDADDTKSWTLAEVETFRESVRRERLYACWLLSCYGMRRSEVLGVRWSRFDDAALKVRRGESRSARTPRRTCRSPSGAVAIFRRLPSWRRRRVA
jgi:integrase